jgi:hypothetical protein
MIFRPALLSVVGAIGGFAVPLDDLRPLETPRGFNDPVRERFFSFLRENASSFRAHLPFCFQIGVACCIWNISRKEASLFLLMQARAVEALATVAEEMLAQYGTLEVEWGEALQFPTDVRRLSSVDGNERLPGNGVWKNDPPLPVFFFFCFHGLIVCVPRLSGKSSSFHIDMKLPAIWTFMT